MIGKRNQERKVGEEKVKDTGKKKTIGMEELMST